MSDRRALVLRSPDFARLWVGQAVSDIGSAVTVVVLPLIAVVSLHASALQVGVLAAAEWVPWLLIGLPAGVWVDRVRRRPLMIWCDLARLALMASVPVAAAFGVLALAQLLLVALGIGFATVLFQVAYQAYLPAVVERDDLPAANAVLQGSNAVASIAGPGIGGLLVQAVRAPFALAVDAVSYLVSVLALVAIRRPEPQPARAEQRSLRREISAGVRYVLADPLLRVLTLGPAIANLAFSGYEAISVLFLVREVGVPPSLVGALVASGSVGSVVGALVARRVVSIIGSSRAVWAATLVTAPAGLLIPLTTRGGGLSLFAIGNVVMLGGVLVYNVTVGAFRQAYCPPQLLGRVVATMRFVLFGVIPVGDVLGGALAGTLGARTALWILLGVNVVPGLIYTASPLRRMRELPDGPPRASAEPTGAVTHT